MNETWPPTKFTNCLQSRILKRSSHMPRIFVNGKFLQAGDERFLVKGVTYGTFAPDADGLSVSAACAGRRRLPR